MIVKFEKEIQNCYECPYAEKIYEHGYCGTDCSLLGAYHTIPSNGIDKKCPFLRLENQQDTTKRGMNSITTNKKR